MKEARNKRILTVYFHFYVILEEAFEICYNDREQVGLPGARGRHGY